MNNDSGRNSVTSSDVLFDVLPEKPAPVCVRPGCGEPVPVAESGRGRPTLYCSRSCKSKAARAKAAAGRAVPVRPEGSQAAVLSHIAELQGVATAFLAALDADPVAAYEEFFDRSHSLVARAGQAAADARDEVRWPGVDGQALELRRAEEDLMRPDLLARVSPQVRADTARAENPPEAGPVAEPGETARAANSTAAPGPNAPVDAARAENRTGSTATAPVGPAEQRGQDFEALRRAACTDPVLRFGEPDRLEGIEVFGADWMVASWDAPQAGGVHQLLHRGRPVGWTAPLPDGPWGRAGHIAARHRGGQAAEILAGADAGARTHRGVGDALAAVHRATAPASRPAGTVAVPRDPLLRGLPRSMDVHIPLDEQVFGYGWSLAGWTVKPDVLLVLGEGHQVGWTERGLDGGDGWVAVYGGYFLGDAATEQAALHATPEEAARTIHQAHTHNL